MLAWSSGKINKHGYLRDKEVLRSGPNQIIQQAKFIYSPLDKEFKIENWLKIKKIYINVGLDSIFVNQTILKIENRMKKFAIFDKKTNQQIKKKWYLWSNEVWRKY